MLGRFTQPDTVLDGLNRYAYCGNNPVNYVDPNGMTADYTDPNKPPKQDPPAPTPPSESITDYDPFNAGNSMEYTKAVVDKGEAENNNSSDSKPSGDTNTTAAEPETEGNTSDGEENPQPVQNEPTGTAADIISDAKPAASTEPSVKYSPYGGYPEGITPGSAPPTRNYPSYQYPPSRSELHTWTVDYSEIQGTMYGSIGTDKEVGFLCGVTLAKFSNLNTGEEYQALFSFWILYATDSGVYGSVGLGLIFGNVTGTFPSYLQYQKVVDAFQGIFNVKIVELLGFSLSSIRSTYYNGAAVAGSIGLGGGAATYITDYTRVSPITSVWSPPVWKGPLEPLLWRPIRNGLKKTGLLK